MVVLSLFDGISGGQLALQRAGIKVDKYYASEIDKYAIQITQKNFPGTVQLGDVTKYAHWNIERPDIIIGGFPCQPYSIAGKRLGLQDDRGGEIVYAMFEVIDRYKPKYFLLENVKGLLSIDKGNTFKEIINTLERFGYEVNWKIINSALVSAQNRERIFISNISFDMPQDKEIFLKDVVFNDALFCGRTVGRRTDENGVRKDYSLFPAVQRLEIRTDDKSGTITTVQKDNTVLTKEGFTVCMHNLYGGFKEKEHRTFLDKSPTIRTAAGGGHIPSLLLSDKALEYMDREVAGGRTHLDFKHHLDVQNPKSVAVVANFFKGVPYNVLKDWNCIRYFDPVEVERLQTYPDNYTEGISKTQRYKALGNSFTVDVIAHILGGID